MSSNLRDQTTAAPKDQEQPGFDPDELRAEQAGDLPERDAMSVIGKDVPFALLQAIAEMPEDALRARACTQTLSR